MDKKNEPHVLLVSSEGDMHIFVGDRLKIANLSHTVCLGFSEAKKILDSGQRFDAVLADVSVDKDCKFLVADGIGLLRHMHQWDMLQITPIVFFSDDPISDKNVMHKLAQFDMGARELPPVYSKYDMKHVVAQLVQRIERPDEPVRHEVSSRPVVHWGHSYS